MACTTRLDLGCFEQGKEIEQLSVDLSVDLTDFTLAANLRKDSVSGKKIAEYSIGSGFTIVDAATGQFTIDAISTTGLESGLYFEDIFFTDVSGDTKYVLPMKFELKETTY